MLRIVLKFNDVVPAIIAPHQVGLRAAPHTPYVLDSKPHGPMLFSHSPCRKQIVPLREPGGARMEIHGHCDRMKHIDRTAPPHKQKARAALPGSRSVFFSWRA